jgi:putative oxidoreductase
LLVLRLAVVSFVIHNCFALIGVTTRLPWALAIIAGGAGLLLLFGLWTPVAAALITLIEAWYLISLPGSSWDVFLGGSIAAGLALLGPGAYSVDARRYGRRRISFGDR